MYIKTHQIEQFFKNFYGEHALAPPSIAHDFVKIEKASLAQWCCRGGHGGTFPL